MSYYKRIDKKSHPFKSENDYETLKNKNGVIVSTEGDCEFLLVPTEMLDEFVPTTISRNDFRMQYYDPSKISDEQMQTIADNMGELWMDEGYWDCIVEWAYILGLDEFFDEDD